MLADVAQGEPFAVDLSEHRLAAFELLFETHRPGALRLAYALTGDAQVAEDVVAEAFARTYARWAKDAVRDPDQYVRRAVVNEVRSVWRRRAVRRRHDERAPAREVTTSPADDRIADADVLQRALATLPIRMRAAVVLRVVEDLSERETASVLGCSVGTVKAYLSRGLDRLRQTLVASEGASSG